MSSSVQGSGPELPEHDNPARLVQGRHLPVSFSAMRHHHFRPYFVCTMLSMMADNIEHVISYWVMFQRFHSPALLGFAVISHWIPYLLLSWYFGVLADRFDCRRVIQVSQGIFTAVTLGWALLIMFDALQPWHAAVFLVFHGLAGALWNPASQLILHDMVGADHLPSAVRLNATGRQLGILLGPAVGGGLMLVCGPALGLMVNAVIYLPLTIWLHTVPYTGHQAGNEPSKRLTWKQALAAMRSAQGNRVIVSMIVLAGLSSLFVGNAFQAQMPVFALALGTDTAGYGYSALLAANGAGAVVGGVLLEGRSLLRTNAPTAIVLAALWCLALGGFAMTTSYVVALVLLFAAGVTNLAFLATAQTLVQLLAPGHLRGRLIGLFNMSGLGLRTFSGVTVGLLGSSIGVHKSLTLSVTALLLVTLILLLRVQRAANQAAYMAESTRMPSTKRYPGPSAP
jgi:MFS family permease